MSEIDDGLRHPASASDLNEPDHANVIAPPPVIYLVFVLLGLIMHYIWPLPIIAAAKIFWIAIIIITMGVVIAILARREFERSGTSVRPDRPTTTIIRTGPYRYSRNPLYLSLTLIQTGIGVWVNSLWVLLMIIPAVLTMRHGVIVREEKYLARKFGKEYMDYKASVRRWL